MAGERPPAPAKEPLPFRFRSVALLEGLSFLLLLFVAMPLKYLADTPGPTRVIGMAHGVLFLAYVALLLELTFSQLRSMRWGLYAFIASLLPCGTFLLLARDHRTNP